MHKRSAFTLFELLVVLAVLAVLAGAIMPAVIKLRITAQRIQSQSNLRQLGLAVQNYESANGKFPAGNDANNFSAAAHLLPYVEQENVSQLIDFTKPVDDKANEKARATQVKVFLAPRDALKAADDKYGATNYLFNAGAKPELKDNDGIFYQDSAVRIADISDGTSNTIMAGETLRGDGGTKAVDVRRQHVRLDKKELKDLKDESGADDWKNGKNIVGDRCASWMDGRFLQGTFTGTRPPNDARPDVDCGGVGGLSALRSYDETVNVAFCDGSVRTIKVKISAKTWSLLCSRNDGQVIPDDF